MTKNMSVMGIYTDRTTVAEAVTVLQKVGYRATDIAVLSSDNPGSKDFAHERRTKTFESAAKGSVEGGVIGAILGWLVSDQSVTIGVLAPFVAAAPVVAALAGAGVLGAIGWIVGAFAGRSQPEYVAKRYAGRIRRGGILLSVHCDSEEWCDRARKTLKDTGARQISASSEAAADYGTTDRPTERTPATAINSVDGLSTSEKESRHVQL
jgi:hypothetical protein